jgi:lysophospholipase L1-like esterase
MHPLIPSPKPRALTRLALAWLVAVAAGLPPLLAAEPRFEKDIRAFIEADKARPPAPGGILFVGSSIFREWSHVADAMAPLPVVNRAFGGSRTGDQLDRFDAVVSPHAPRVVVYYCGSNDLKAGHDPEAIFARFKAFSDRLAHDFPSARLLYVAATRSPDRVPLWDRVDHYNALVRAHCRNTPLRQFIDINPALVDAAGCPRTDLYRDDKLHFHPHAYDTFAAIIRPALEAAWKDANARP